MGPSPDVNHMNNAFEATALRRYTYVCMYVCIVIMSRRCWKTESDGNV